MGLIDRAFGADKNSLMFNRLSLHWMMVASHHENFLKKHEMAEDQVKTFVEIQSKSSDVAGLANSSVKGFGVSSPDIAAILNNLEKLSKLQAEVNIMTDKGHWLPELINITRLILSGDTRRFKSSQYWFSE